MAKQVFTITIPNWEKHNGSKKKNHRYILLETRFFEDGKITQLKQIEVLMFLKCLTIAGDLLSNRFEVHAGMLPKRWRIDDKSLENCLKTLQEYQLVTYQKNDSLLIQYNTIQKNRREEKEVEKLPPPLDPFFKSKFDPSKLPETALIWNENCGSLTKVVSTVRGWNQKSQSIIDDYGHETFRQAVTRVASNSFLTGQNKRNWKATYRWLINEDNLAKVLNGDYENEQSVDAMMKELERALGEAS